MSLFANKKITVAEWQLDLAAVVYIAIGVGLGLFLVLSGGIGRAFAVANSSVNRDTDTQLSQGTLTNTQVVGSGSGAYVQLSSNQGPGGDSWYNTSWQYRKKVTFNNSAQAENLIDFPVLIDLSSSNFTFSKALSAGQDIRFTDSDGTTLLSYEIEQWDSVGQVAKVWVKVPQIDASSSTDYIYMYYGNSGAADAQSINSVWDSNFKAVWHMNQAGGTDPNMKDSTSNANNLGFGSAQTGADLVTGQIDGAQDFDGTVNDQLTKSNPTPNLNILSTITLEAWIKRNDGLAVVLMREFGTPENYAFKISNSTDLDFEYRTFSTTHTYRFPFADDNTWRHVAITFTYGTGSSIKAYVNGSVVSGSWVAGDGNQTPYNDAVHDFSIGNSQATPFTGQMDEVRISNSIRSAAWIAADYKSQTSNFATFGAEQGVLPPSGTWEGPSDSNVIDVIWNGGWGDGTSGSTAFSATVANVSANATIAFQMRTAATTGALTAATYQTLGTANSGTTFTRTKAQLDALGLSTGTNRYIQVKATLVSTDGVSNPRLDSFTIYYQSDNTAPEVNASSVQMLKVASGDSVSSNGWTNNTAPYFSWTAASDSQSGVNAYCLYLGTDSNGDPASSKGLLGTSPVSISGTPCQFVTTSTNIDFANTSLRGVTWLTTSNSPYYLNVKTFDNNNNLTSTSAQFQFRFDNTVPTNPAFISLPGDFISSKDATITWPTAGGDAASDGNSGVLGLQYRIGSSGTWYGDSHSGSQDITDLLANDGSYTTNPTFDYPALNEGTNVVYIRTWDNAGNVSTLYVSGALKVNTIAPSSPQNLTAIPATNTTNSYSFSWNPPNTFTGQIGNIRYCYTINVLPTAQNCAYTLPSVTSLSADAYATQPGTNTIYVVAKDEAGNINYETYASATFTYSGSAPGMAQDIDVSDISVKATANWRLVVSWDAPASVGAGIKEYKVYRGITNTTCSGDIGSFTQIGTTAGKSYTDSGLTQQRYYYCVRVCDSANNCSAVSDTKNGFPAGKFTEAAALTSGPVVTEINARRAKITWTTDRDSDSKVAVGTTSLHYLPEEPSKSDQTTDHQINLTNLKPGTTYYFKSKWTDADGNTGSSDEKVFQTQPAPTISSSKVGNIGIAGALVQFTSANAARVKIYYGTTSSFGGATEVATSVLTSSYTVQLSNLNDNTKYYYKINPFDTEGNEYEGTVLDFTTLPRPRISAVKVTEVKGEAQPTVEVSWTSNTDVSSIVSYYPSGRKDAEQQGVDTKFVTGTHKLIIRGLAANSQYELIVKGRDKYGNEGSSETQRFSTGVDTRPPRIYNVKVEGAIVNPIDNSGENPTAQLIISWDTDEPASSQIEYNEGTGTEYTQSTQRDNSLTYNHLVIISKLQPSKVYHLRVVSRDGVGNEGKSVDSVTITPKASESALEIVIKNLRDIFNFL
jgi:hypothetical protein